MKVYDLEEAWSLLEEAMKENKAQPLEQQQNGKSHSANGNTETDSMKRKLLEDDTDDAAISSKKTRVEENIVENGNDEEVKSEKFNWSDVIRNILLKKNNEINLGKLRKKVFNKYKNFYGSELGDKLENKFNKKLKNLNGIVIDHEKVRLIE